MAASGFFIGLDLGQRQDFSAIAVVERRQEGKRVWYAVRGAERTPLGTPYPQVVARVKAILESPELVGRSSLVVDATGVGAPVVDALRAALAGGGGYGERVATPEIVAVTMTGGERAVEARGSFGIQRWNVPKRDLVAGVQVLLAEGELKIARGMREAGPLMRELLDIRITARGTGRVRMGADGGGEHDDLAMALALACWRARNVRGMAGGGRLPGM
jgi:hypothetical protein